jgi:hypothetical protein
MHLVEVELDETMTGTGYERHAFGCPKCRERLQRGPRIRPLPAERMRLPSAQPFAAALGVTIRTSWARAVAKLSGWKTELDRRAIAASTDRSRPFRRIVYIFGVQWRSH